MQRKPLGFYQDIALHPPLKVGVFNKLHQLKGVVNELEKVVGLSQEQRQEWMMDNQEQILKMFKTFQDYVKLDLDQEDLDKEMLELLTEYSRALQECAAYVHALFPEVRLQG